MQRIRPSYLDRTGAAAGIRAHHDPHQPSTSHAGCGATLSAPLACDDRQELLSCCISSASRGAENEAAGFHIAARPSATSVAPVTVASSRWLCSKSDSYRRAECPPRRRSSRLAGVVAAPAIIRQPAPRGSASPRLTRRKNSRVRSCFGFVKNTCGVASSTMRPPSMKTIRVPTSRANCIS